MIRLTDDERRRVFLGLFTDAMIDHRTRKKRERKKNKQSHCHCFGFGFLFEWQSAKHGGRPPTDTHAIVRFVSIIDLDIYRGRTGKIRSPTSETFLRVDLDRWLSFAYSGGSSSKMINVLDDRPTSSTKRNDGIRCLWVARELWNR